ncbi:MAG TPA: hypothetical protein VMJ32_12820 [Pirellulales bacterium]|nr:hypothetical protein [Pirellulales bacterium]
MAVATKNPVEITYNLIDKINRRLSKAGEPIIFKEHDGMRRETVLYRNCIRLTDADVLRLVQRFQLGTVDRLPKRKAGEYLAFVHGKRSGVSLSV